MSIFRMSFAGMAEEAAVAKWGFLRSLFNWDVGERGASNVRDICYVFYGAQSSN